MKTRLLCLSLLLILFIAGCNKAAALPIVSKATPLPTPNKGTATVTGKLINKDGKAPVADHLVRLSRIYGEGTNAIYVYNESSDPGNYTDADGFFVIDNVPPGPYAIILIDDNGNYSPIIESSEKIITVDTVADQVLSMGDILVDLNGSAKQ